MQASTWHSTPRRAAAAATSATGSTTPCAYEGAETTTSAVRSLTAAARSAARGRKLPGSTPTLTTRRPNRCAALWKAACAVTGRTISGAVTPRVRRACSRAVSTASRQLSVPPLVNVPAVVPSRPPRRAAACPTTSFSSVTTLGKAVMSRPLTPATAACAAAASASRPASPESYT